MVVLTTGFVHNLSNALIWCEAILPTCAATKPSFLYTQLHFDSPWMKMVHTPLSRPICLPSRHLFHLSSPSIPITFLSKSISIEARHTRNLLRTIRPHTEYSSIQPYITRRPYPITADLPGGSTRGIQNTNQDTRVAALAAR